MKTRTLLALAATSAVLAACGGGGGGDSGPTTTTTNTNGSTGVPQSAQSSVAGLVAYLQTLIAGSNETDTPVSLDGVTLPVDDAAPPLPI